MSRNRPYQYEVTRTPETVARWEDLFLLPYDVVTRRILEGGSCVDGVVHVWLYCNKTKAHRLAQRLDAHFGATGTLVNLRDVAEEDDEFWRYDARGLRICDHGWGEDDGCAAGCFD